MLSHDAFLIISELCESGGETDRNELERQVSARLTNGFVHAWDYLLDRQIVETVRSFDRSEVSIVAKLKQPDKFIKKPSKFSIDEVVSSAVDRRNFSAPYQSVLAGKTARADPVMIWAAELSRSDKADFWKKFMEMSDAEQANFRRRVARPASRSGRN